MKSYMDMLASFAESGSTTLHLDTQWNNRWGTLGSDLGNEVHHTRGNLSFTCSTDSVKDLVLDWSWNGQRHCAPRSTDDLLTASFRSLVELAQQEAERD